jgi:hypothetical protein
MNTSILLPFALACIALALRVSSIRRLGTWSIETLYFFVCAAVAALMLAPRLTGTSRMSFLEESAVRGVERVPTVMDQIGFGYAALIEFAAPVMWLVGVATLEVLARAWARHGGMPASTAARSPTSRKVFSLPAAMPLVVSLCVLVGPALLLWGGLRVALADPTLVYSTPSGEPNRGAQNRAVVLNWLAVPLLLYLYPGKTLLPRGFAVAGTPYAWANADPDAIITPASLKAMRFPSSLLQFVLESTPWIIAAVLLSWLYSMVDRR